MEIYYILSNFIPRIKTIPKLINNTKIGKNTIIQLIVLLIPHIKLRSHVHSKINNPYFSLINIKQPINVPPKAKD